MSEIRVDVPIGLFGSATEAYIQEDGKIEVPNGMGRRVVGEIDNGDVYVNDGFFTRTKVLEGDGRGAFYRVDGAGILGGRRSLAFRLDASGDVRNADGEYVYRLNVNKTEFLDKHGSQKKAGNNADAVASSKSSDSSGSEGVGIGLLPLRYIIAVLVAGWLLLGSAYVFWGNIRPENATHQSIIFVLLLIGSFVIGTILAFRKQELTTVKEKAGIAVAAYLAGAFAYALFAIIEASINQTLTIPDILVALLFTPIYMLGASLPLLAIQSAGFWLARKFVRK